MTASVSVESCLCTIIACMVLHKRCHNCLNLFYISPLPGQPTILISQRDASIRQQFLPKLEELRHSESSHFGRIRQQWDLASLVAVVCAAPTLLMTMIIVRMMVACQTPQWPQRPTMQRHQRRLRGAARRHQAGHGRHCFQVLPAMMAIRYLHGLILSLMAMTITLIGQTLTGAWPALSHIH